MKSVNARAAVALAIMAVILGALLFGTAGTLHYWQAWTYLIVYFVTGGAITIYMANRSPALLDRRLKAGLTAEPDPVQRVIQSLAALAYFGLFILAGLDRRLAWSAVSIGAFIVGELLVLIGMFIAFLAYRENAFASATITVEQQQPVVTTGPYAHVRHPLYSGVLLMLLGSAPALGSWWALLAVAVLTVVIMARLLREERYLAERLTSYREYCAKVCWRLIPRVF